ncbi:hypothetical protein TNCV_3043101 [Trichonephila clavipes]|nr:hypothetical protein TNCV_3043101 [Trichonephila clavipes]
MYRCPVRGEYYIRGRTGKFRFNPTPIVESHAAREHGIKTRDPFPTTVNPSVVHIGVSMDNQWHVVGVESPTQRIYGCIPSPIELYV